MRIRKFNMLMCRWQLSCPRWDEPVICIDLGELRLGGGDALFVAVFANNIQDLSTIVDVQAGVR